jgi:sugar phosphate isomerase/epimerase
MSIKFGMPTLIELSPIDDCVKLCKELNLDFIEINMNLPQYQIEELDVCHLKQIMHEENIFFT